MSLAPGTRIGAYEQHEVTAPLGAGPYDVLCSIGAECSAGGDREVKAINMPVFTPANLGRSRRGGTITPSAVSRSRSVSTRR